MRVFHIRKCETITSKTFFQHQSGILQPVVDQTWIQHQSLLLQTVRVHNRSLLLLGDGRADSPGHNAKFGSYTVTDVVCNKVVYFKLVQVNVWKQDDHFYDHECLMPPTSQSNEVGGIYYMEKEGLKRVLNYLEQQHMQVGVLVTDRHRQINKSLRENHANITYYYDVWQWQKVKII